MVKEVLNNVLLVSGCGRNVGKTSFICHLIKHCQNPVICIKISNHFHKKTDSLKTIINKSNLFIGIETDCNSTKDTSRYLQAGALQSYYIQSQTDQISEVVKFVIKEAYSNTPIIIESSTIGQYIEPGIGCFVVSKEVSKYPKWEYEYIIIKGIIEGETPQWPLISWNAVKYYWQPNQTIIE